MDDPYSYDNDLKMFLAVLEKFKEDFQPAVLPYPKGFTFDFSEIGRVIVCTISASDIDNAKKQLKSIWPSVKPRGLHELKEMPCLKQIL